VKGTIETMSYGCKHTGSTISNLREPLLNYVHILAVKERHGKEKSFPN
jgi:hypothetical protein